MTKQTNNMDSLSKSHAGVSIFRMCALTLAAAVAMGASISGQAQNNPATGTPAPTPVKKQQKPEAEKTLGKYQLHQTVEMGGRIVEKSGSRAMWATMVNQNGGMRILSHSLEMRTTDRSKTPFFDTLSSQSFGYGGDPNDVSTLNLSKGKTWDFAGTFRRDRNYFDYNLMVNPLLGSSALVPVSDSLHMYNTVRRNTNTLLTLFPVSPVKFRAGYNHNTMEGPSYSSVHQGGDVQVEQWFRNSTDTLTAGVDVKVAPRTSLSYDQIFVMYKGDSPYWLVGANYKTQSGAPVSVGVTVLNTATCGTGANKTLEVVNGVVNPYCSQSLVQSQVAPTRTQFPTEQVRFASKYWEKVSMTGRLAYSGGVSNVNNFNETFIGLLSRTYLRQEIDTGGMANGRLAHNKHVSVNADYAVEGEINDRIAISDSVTFWDFRNTGASILNTTNWAGTAAKPPSMNTPVSSLTPTTITDDRGGFLAQKNIGNTMLAAFTVNSYWKLTTGWRFNNRAIKLNDDDTLQWHQNWALLGMSLQPGAAFRLNVNYEKMFANKVGQNTTADTYTRTGLDRADHVRVRTAVKPYKFMSLNAAANVFVGKNTDPMVNHKEHNYDVSLGAQIEATDNLSFDLNAARDEAFSRTDLCYLVNTVAAPYGDQASAGTCLYSASNPNGTKTTTAVTSQLRLGNGYYRAPVTYISGSFNYVPTRYVKLNAGARVTDTRGSAELLNPNQAYGALNSTILSPFADAELKIAPQWTWHGNWNYQDYNETNGGPAPRSFLGHIVTLGVRYAF